MTTSVFDTRDLAKQEMMRRLDEDLSDLIRLVLRRHGCRYAVDYLGDTGQLPLAPDLVIAGPHVTTPIDGGQPSGSARNDEGSRGGKDETDPDNSTTSALPEIMHDPIECVVVIHEHDFRRDRILAEVEDAGPDHNRQLTIETHDLSDADWTTLMRAGRGKQPVRLLVRSIASGEHRINRSRVVATRLVGVAQSAQLRLL